MECGAGTANLLWRDMGTHGDVRARSTLKAGRSLATVHCSPVCAMMLEENWRQPGCPLWHPLPPFVFSWVVDLSSHQNKGKPGMSLKVRHY